MMMGRDRITINPKGQVVHLRTKKPVEPRLLDGKVVKVAAGRRSAQGAGRLDHRAGQPVLRPRHGQLGLGAALRQGAGRPARRHEPVQPARPPRAARRPGAAFRRAQVRPPRPDPDDRHSRRPTARRRRRCRATRRTRRLFSHHLPRPLTAHQMADALAQATDVPNFFANDAPPRHGPPAAPSRSPTRRRAARSSTRSADARGPPTCAASPAPTLSLRPGPAPDRRRRHRGQGLQLERLPRQRH